MLRKRNVIKFGIGKQSNGTDYSIVIDGHLFVSHIEVAQINNIFMTITEVAGGSAPVIASTSKDLAEVLIRSNEHVQIVSDVALLDKGFKELSRRQKLKNPEHQSPLYLMVENIWNLVAISNTKARANRLVELLVKAPAYKIFLISGSMLSLRNLLTQLIDNNPKLKNKLPANSMRPIGALGAELVYSTEGFAYYKRKEAMEFERLY